METIAIVVGVCPVVVIAVSWALLAPKSPVRRAINTWSTDLLEREKATEVYRTAYEFTVPLPAQQVIDVIEQRWGRMVPTGEPQFYVHSAIYEQQVVLRFGNAARPKFFAARIDFETREPATGTLWFYEAEDLDLVGAPISSAPASTISSRNCRRNPFSGCAMGKSSSPPWKTKATSSGSRAHIGAVETIPN